MSYALSQDLWEGNIPMRAYSIWRRAPKAIRIGERWFSPEDSNFPLNAVSRVYVRAIWGMCRR